MSRQILIIFLSLFLVDLTAQSNAVASGGEASGTGGTMSYTVGQLDYATNTGDGGITTQGVQQPFEISVTTGILETGINLQAVVFPNPATDRVELQIDDDVSALPLTFTLYDVNGQMLNHVRITENPMTIPLSGLTSGVYILSVSSPYALLKTFKISINN